MSIGYNNKRISAEHDMHWQRLTKRVDAVGIEPTTFHMCEDAKRLKTLLVECSVENRIRTEKLTNHTPWRVVSGKLEVANDVVITY